MRTVKVCFTIAEHLSDRMSELAKKRQIDKQSLLETIILRGLSQMDYEDENAARLRIEARRRKAKEAADMEMAKSARAIPQKTIERIVDRLKTRTKKHRRSRAVTPKTGDPLESLEV